MASPFVYESIGGSQGARLATRAPVFMSGVVWYVGPGGADAVSPQGRERVYPLATLAQAHTNASAGDTIICLENHTETLTAAQTFNKAGIHVWGEGSSSTRPRFTCNGAIAMFDITAAGVTIENIYFPQSGTAPTARVRIASVGCQVVTCQFDCGASDTASALRFVTGAGQARVVGTRFVSTATSVTNRPTVALEVVNAMSDLELDTVIFDGGTYAWSDFAFKGTAAITRLVGIDVDFLNSADLQTATGSIYKFHPRSKTGSVHLDFTA